MYIQILSVCHCLMTCVLILNVIKVIPQYCIVHPYCA